MAGNRDEILANFQGITGVDDVAMAIFHLEEAEWDLTTAVNTVMASQDNTPKPNETMEIIDEDVSIVTTKTQPPDIEDCNEASTSSNKCNKGKLIKLKVLFKNGMYDVSMHDTKTIWDLQSHMENMLKVPICKHVSPTATLKSLNLKNNSAIRVVAAISDEEYAKDEVAQSLAAKYNLRVTHNGKEFMLQFPGTKTVREVKNDIYSFTDIPVRLQVWSGWPDIKGLDETVLAMVGLNKPHHDLTLTTPDPRPTPMMEINQIVMADSSDSDSSVEDVEDSTAYVADEDMFVDVAQNDRLQPLLSAQVEDEALGCIEFAQRFRERYGPNIPNFFEGTLQDAIKEACLKPANERKLFGLYLHHEKSVLSNVFCAQLLGCDTVLQTLAANFIVYGWDLTNTNNCNMLLASISNSLGPVASMTVRSIPVDRLPALIIIMRVRSNTEIHSVINGNVGVSELLGMLVEAIERFSQQRTQDAKAEQEREARQKVKREQDEAYQRSLEADRAKEEFKKQQELERTQEIKRVEFEKQVEESKKEELRYRAQLRVPDEPAEGAANVTRIRVRLPPPHEKALERRFNEQDTLQALLDYIAAQGFPRDKYKVIASWPRRDLTTESESSTLKALKLFPQETVLLEER